MKIKNIFVIDILLVLTIFVYGIVLLKINNNEGFFKKYFEYHSIIKSGIDLYTQERIDQLRPDEYAFINEVVSRKKIGNLDLSYLRKKYDQSVFKRLLNKNDYIPGIQIEKKNIVDAIGKPLEGNFYDIKNVDEKSNAGAFGAWNDIILKAMYCDRTGFDNGDFYVLKLLKSGGGGYLDTHYLLSLLLIRKNNCYAEEDLDKQIASVVADIVAAEANDKVFSDLYAERVVLLYWAGYGNLVKKEWVDFIKNNFNEGYGWAEKGETSFNGHVSGLSLLSMIYFIEGNPKQPFYNE